MKILKNELLSKHTTFKIGGAAEYFCSPKSNNELKEALSFAKNNSLKIFIIGNGSNILIPDEGLKGLVIHLKMSKIIISKQKSTIESGVLLNKLLSVFADNGLSGLEFMAGIPGSLGGSICMNSGQGKSSISKFISKVWALDYNGEEHIFSNTQCKFNYRKSIFQKKKLIITKAEFILNKDKADEIKKRIKDLIANKIKRQPYDLPSAGSFFKNPKNLFTGQLIESAGLKGLKINGAQISEKHGNFIVNIGKAKAKDVLKLAEIAKKEVRKKYNISLKPEVILIK
ncbi:MAG: UDP-N-acetylenolpyruvoylglucosamine reductase [Candidatus Saganbacteria bacterium]|uniref:UDP-N-acetylenolpyruvoylglucosamine reductase n=1 Tax=Candidatus Saganbacteria bacterium TaxID=2575572 RepID=A0A833NX09_UNCSA|nr:MAG: UDP-N-acetylenolpyruvoylglucosamine reductase [Candidatus Saganbacteria bacterium]